MEVWYDQPERKVKAFVHDGFEANKTFLRRYDAKQEYVIRDDEFAECRRAYLSECMRFWRVRKASVPHGGGWVPQQVCQYVRRCSLTCLQLNRLRVHSFQTTSSGGRGRMKLPGGERCSTCGKTCTRACGCS